MDDYLSDKEQVERLRQWWRENGWFLLGGVALGLLGLYGYNQYFAYQDRQSEGAGALYLQITQATESNDKAAAETAFAQLRDEFPDNVYTHQAALLVASSEARHCPRQRCREASFHHGAEQRCGARDDCAVAPRARARVSRAVSRRAGSAERAGGRAVRRPHRRDQGRHSRGARRDGCGAHRVSRSDDHAGCRGARSQFPADEDRGLAGRRVDTRGGRACSVGEPAAAAPPGEGA